MLTFTHAGPAEDILYSFYFCRELSRRYDFRNFYYHIQTGIFITEQQAEFLRSLLESQKFIQGIIIGPDRPKNAIDLNKFRNGMINCSSGDMRDYYYQFNSNTLPRHFDICNIRLKQLPDEKYKNDVIINISEKVVNVNLDFKSLIKFKDNLVFIGTQKEYETFCSKNFIIEKCEINPDSMLTVAKYIVGSKGFVGNQNQYFALTECLKTPRILVTNEWNKDISGKTIPGIKNITPIGGRAVVASITEKMVSSVENLLNYTDFDDRKTKGNKND